jgi:hypothetical protein
MMSQIEQQEAAPADNNEKDDDDTFSFVDGVEELCLDASGERKLFRANMRDNSLERVSIGGMDTKSKK